MIEINLVPLHLRKKEAGGIWSSVGIPKVILFGVGGIFITLLVLMHGLLISLWVIQSTRHAIYQVIWQKMSPDKNNIDSINKELQDLKDRTSTIGDIASKKAILWSQKLNILSDTMPKEVWLKKVAWNNNVLTVEGSAVSKLRDEISIVGNFVSDLKKEESFVKDFSSLELTSVTRSKKGVTETADFIITAKVK
ncbi:MAG: PilN domain-containing protein [Candidatus Omnitrophica bacterium]|nr:PilN domain-containing protein [Candidatus Omnitrophota bacterium]